MVLKGAFAALLCSTLLAWTCASADEYRTDEFLKLDLSQAALSPKPLGPPTQFEPVAVKAKADPVVKPAPARTAQVKPARRVKVRPVRTAKVTAVRTAKVTPVRAAKRTPAVRTKLAHKHSNPLDAQAFDARIQVWPCRSGGICNWRPQRK
jgi:hypothetical protein